MVMSLISKWSLVTGERRAFKRSIWVAPRCTRREGHFILITIKTSLHLAVSQWNCFWTSQKRDSNFKNALLECLKITFEKVWLALTFFPIEDEVRNLNNSALLSNQSYAWYRTVNSVGRPYMYTWVTEVTPEREQIFPELFRYCQKQLRLLIVLDS